MASPYPASATTGRSANLHPPADSWPSISSSMSSANRHFCRYRTSSAILHRARRRGVCAACSVSVVVVSSQDSGTKSRQSIAADAWSVTACTLTPIWQLPVLPSAPQYYRATPGESRPSLGKPLSSTVGSDPIRLRIRYMVGGRCPLADILRTLPKCGG